MKNRRQVLKIFIFLFLSFSGILTGCNMKKENTNTSNDVAGLRSLVELDLPVKNARWEVFGTPEYTGGVPGPTDFITLIAEIETSQSTNIGRETGTAWIAPEAARSWLSEGFKLMLEKNKNSSVSLSQMRNCRVLQGKLKKTGKPVDGFICSDSNRALIYLTLVDYATTD